VRQEAEFETASCLDSLSRPNHLFRMWSVQNSKRTDRPPKRPALLHCGTGRNSDGLRW